MEILLDKHVHHLPKEAILQLLESDGENGLDLLEVKARQERFGPNLIPAEAGESNLRRFLLQFHQPLIYILLTAAGITAALQEWVDAGVIFGVVLVNAIIGYLQESKAARALDALAKTTVTEARVVRGGETRTVPSVDLVPGDLVLLQSGDKVPADIRLLRCRDLQIDESALTGESVAVQKTDELLEQETSLAERKNQAYTSTLVTYGQGRGLVVAIGAATEVGRISELLSTADILETPLTRKIERFSKVLLGAILVLAGITFGVGLLRGEKVFDMFMASVALSVGAIPEGLPAVVTITLAIGVARMAKRRAIIRKLPAVETLGSTTTICSDKTGTLTVNQMTVQSVWAGGRAYQVTGTGYETVGSVLTEQGAPVVPSESPALLECFLGGLVCNDSALVEKEGKPNVDGDPTEGALLVSGCKAGLDRKEWERRLKRVDTVPFESQHKYMATLHRKSQEEGTIVYVKGAVESLTARCKDALAEDGSRVPLDMEGVTRAFEGMAAQGLRVLGIARADLPADKERIDHEDIRDLTFVGFQGMIDPPRPEAIAAVGACHGAGMKVKMITGDHVLTARAIAKQLGLYGQDPGDGIGPRALTGQELEAMSDQALLDIVEEVNVFARVSPEQKLRLVRALQAKGHVAAMTGDGVNDAPALRQADIGVAMGRTGTEVAKEASDMVLTDDNFATIEAAVEEGRGVFDNLVKFIVWTLPTNLGEGLVILAAIFTGAVLPILPVQILWINMTTAVLLGMMLAFEPKEKDIMKRPPRDPDVPILTGTLILRMMAVSLIMLLGAFGSFNWTMTKMLAQGVGEEAAAATARTVAVNVFVMVELFYLYNCRSLTKSMFALGLFTNPWVMVGSTVMIVLQLGFTYAPFMNQLFHTAPIGWDAWWRILLTAVATYLTIGAEKWLRRWWWERKDSGQADPEKPIRVPG